MTPLAIAMDVFLAVLLIAALAMGVRLNGRLKALRDAYQGFAKAIVGLNEAASRAESGLAALREATSETHDSLLSRIETARSLAGKLDGQINAARNLIESEQLTRAIKASSEARTPAKESAPPSAVLKLAERFGVIKGQGEPEPAAVRSERVQPLRPERPSRPDRPLRASQVTRRRNDFEDDLFAPPGSVDGAASAMRPAPQLRSDRFTAEREEDEQPMTLTQVASEDQALDDFAARIRARRAGL
jgi:hypothetical protein